MNNLPKNQEVKIEYLNEAFNSMNTSYKIFCFKAIYDEIILENYTIDFKTLACRMIQNVWYPLLKYKLNLGKQDQLQKIVEQIYIKNIIDINTEPNKLLKILKEVVSDDIIDELLRYVIYRLIRPTFVEQLKGIKKDYLQQKVIMELCEKNFECLYRIDSVRRLIHINNCWFKYIIENQGIVSGWLRYKLIEFLQKRNPNIPAIINKLDRESNRELKDATKVWRSLIDIKDIKDVYTEKLITLKSFDTKNYMSIDHFIPWSFIGHNMVWNLIPTFKTVNSSKGDKLPNWDKYFNKFIKQQYELFCFLRLNYAKYKIILEDYLEIFREYDINNITSENTSISYEFFYNAMMKSLQPVYQIAYNQGFNIWSFEENIKIKSIEENNSFIIS